MSKGEIMSDILISALHANEVLHANASSNVANMNTRDYKSLRTTITEGQKGSVDTVTVRTTTEGAPTEDGHQTSNVDLPREFTDMILARRGFESILAAISTREEMMNDLMKTFSSIDEQD
jgi:flagellar hook protein FlgE